MTDEYDEQENEPLDENIRRELKEARATRKALGERDAQFAALQRDSAFDKAGIPEEGMGSLFRKAYDGELNKESIVKQAMEFGVLQPQSTGTEAELAALRAAHEASAEGGATNVEDPGARFLKDLDAAKSQEEIMALIANADPSIGVSVPSN